jgi:hypothetical protein
MGTIEIPSLEVIQHQIDACRRKLKDLTRLARLARAHHAAMQRPATGVPDPHPLLVAIDADAKAGLTAATI